MARTIESHPIGREPRQGELNYELKRVLTKHCSKKSLKQAAESVQLAVARLAKQFGFKEFSCEYERSTSLGDDKPWVNESIQVLIYRRRSNGTMSIYRAGVTSYPHFFKKKGDDFARWANLSAPRDISIYYGVDEPYTWENFYRSKKLPARIVAKRAKMIAARKQGK